MAKKRRLTLDISPAANIVLENIQQEFGLTITDVVIYGLTLMNIYTKAISHKKQVQIHDPLTDIDCIVEIPLFSNKNDNG